MFMIIIMSKAKVCTKQLHEEELDFLKASEFLDATEELMKIQNDKTAMNLLLDAMAALAEKYEIQGSR